MQISRRISDGLIIQYGDGIGQLDDAVLLNVDDATAQAIRAAQPANPSIPFAGLILVNPITDANGITSGSVQAVSPPPIPAPDPALADYRSTISAMDARLTDILTNGGAYTVAQMQMAIVDEARIVRRILRYLSARVG